MKAATRLAAAGLAVGYDDRTVLSGLDVEVPDGQFTVIVGPNACGKSTLLRTLARMLKPQAGTVVLDGKNIADQNPKAVARILGLLPQTPISPDGILVEDLVARGRYPHQGLLRQWSDSDQKAVDEALERANVAELRDRFISELSGGQRQRVWIALVLAQQTDIVLLDEPTTYLDISHQVEVLDLCRSMTTAGTTVVAVLHDLNLAFRYADHTIVMKDGEIVVTGKPADIVTADLIEHVYDLRCQIITDPASATPLVVPEWGN